PTIERLSVVLDRMTGTNEERMAQLVSSISETFRSNLTESARGEFQGLATAVAATTKTLEASVQGSALLQEKLGTLLEALDNGRQRQEESSQAQQRALQAIVAEMTANVRAVTADTSTSLSGTVERLI